MNQLIPSLLTACSTSCISNQPHISSDYSGDDSVPQYSRDPFAIPAFDWLIDLVMPFLPFLGR